MNTRSHTHVLSYLLKTDKKGRRYSAQVVQLPGVITEGKSPGEIKKKIPKITKTFLDTFDDIHEEVLRDPRPRLVDSGHGIIVETVSFEVKC